MDIFTPAKRSEIMKLIPNKNTKPELLMRKTLFALGLRYRLHDNKITGRPDIVLHKSRVIVFVDGDWWHGRHFQTNKKRYTSYWQDKIQANIDRDEFVNQQLSKEGWKVFRVWQKDLEKDPVKYGRQIYEYVHSVNKQQSIK